MLFARKYDQRKLVDVVFLRQQIILACPQVAKKVLLNQTLAQHADQQSTASHWSV